MPKWNLSTPYMLTVIAVVMTIVARSSSSPACRDHSHNRLGPFVDRPIDQLGASHVVDRVVAMIADAGHEMARPWGSSSWSQPQS